MKSFMSLLIIRLFILVILTNVNVITSFSQNVGINSNGATPKASAGLDIDFSNKGILVPRVSLSSTTDASTITSPETSLLVYNTNSSMTGGGVGFWYWDGAKWVRFLTGSTSLGGSAWLLLGNSGTTWNTNFIGTTDNVSFRIRTNNIERMIVDSMGNVIIGYYKAVGTFGVYRDDASVSGQIVNANSSTPRYPSFTIANYGGATTGGHPVFAFTNSNGSRTTPLAITAGIGLGSIIFQGHNGTKVIQAARVEAYADSVFTATRANSSLAFLTGSGIYSACCSMTEKMRITSTGNVGIGTSTPVAKLTVGSDLFGTAHSSSIRTNAGALGTTANSEISIASFGFTSVNNSALGIRAYRNSNGSDWTTSSIGIGVDIDNTIRVNNAALWFGFNGNVGIGIVTPAEKLHISGTARVSSLAGAGTRMVQSDLNGTLLNLATGTANQVLLGTGVWGNVPTNTAWSLTGNAGTLWASNFIGTTDNVSFRIRTNNLERVIVDSTGKVGIGTKSPAAKIHLVDENNSGWRYEQYHNGDGTNFRNFRARGTVAAPSSILAGDRLACFIAGGYHSGAAFSGLMAGFNIYAAENFTATALGTYLTFTTSQIGTIAGQVERMRITDAGYIGIGIIAPTSIMHIKASSPTLNIQNTNSAYGAGSILEFGHDQTSNTVAIAKIYSFLTDGSASRAGDLRFQTSTGGVLADRMTIMSTGNVGVGNTSPGAKFHVDDATKAIIMSQGVFGAQMTGSSSGSALFGTNMYVQNGTLTLKTTGTHGSGYGYAGVNPTWGDIAFYAQRGVNTTADATVTPSARMYIEGTNGYVGIGTSSPAEKLNVVGNIRASSLAGTGTRMVQADANGTLLPLAAGTALQVLLGTGVWGSVPTNTAWALLGNAGTDPLTNFLGTTDNVALVFRTNSIKSGRIDPAGPTFLGYQAGFSNTATTTTSFGFQSLFSNTTGAYNTASGYQSLYSNTTGTDNVASGYQALYTSTTGANNTALGSKSLYLTTTGFNNTAIGRQSLQNNTTGSANMASGYQSLMSNISANNNTAIGSNSLQSNTTGSSNTAVGMGALMTNTTANNNTAVGFQALLSNTTGTPNTAMGYQSLLSNTTGSNNTANGYQALFSNSTGGNNTAVGYMSLYLNTSGWDNTAIGRYALRANTTGANNTASGETALFSNTTGGSNTASGYGALYFNTTGAANTANGYLALYNNTTGFYNVATGYGALQSNTTSSNNTAYGYQSLNSNTGANNIALGYQAGINMTSGSNNIIVGYNINAPVLTGSNQLNIGNVIYGDLSTSKIGIGVTAPAEALHVSGNARISNLAGVGSRMVQADANGTLAELVAGTANQVLLGTGVWGNVPTNTAWSLLGNSGTVWSTNFLGTTDNVSLRFRTNNTEKMIIDSIGNVVIGQSSNPNLIKFLVNGTGGVSSMIQTTRNNNSFGARIWVRGTNAGSLGLSNTAATDDAVLLNGSGDSYFNSGGNLGIGTKTPAEALHVVGNVRVSNLSGTGSRMVQADANGTLAELVAGTANQVLLGTGVWGNVPTNTAWSLTGNSGTDPSTNFIGTTDVVDFLVKTSNTERMRILSTGNLGIGTNNPLYFTDIRSASTNSQIHIASSNSDDGMYLVSAGAENGFMSGGSAFQGGSWTAKSTSAWEFGGGATGITAFFDAGLTVGNTFSPTARFKLTSSGYFGIATTNPTSLFSVGATSQFQVNSSGNLVKVNDVSYSFPASQGAASTFLQNDGAGNLSWTSVPSPITGSCASGANYIPKMSSSTAVTCSQIFDDGTNVGIGCNNPQYKLHVIGDIACDGTITAPNLSISSITACSDMRYKKNITPLSNSLENVLKIQGVNYYWKVTEFPKKMFNGNKQIGFIAQDLEKIYPEVVITNKEGYKSIDYSKLTPILVEAIKEQQKQIEELKVLVNKLIKQKGN